MKKLATTLTVLIAAAVVSGSAVANSKEVKIADKAIKSSIADKNVKVGKLNDELNQKNGISVKVFKADTLKAFKDAKAVKFAGAKVKNQSNYVEVKSNNKFVWTKDAKWATEWVKSEGIAWELKIKELKACDSAKFDWKLIKLIDSKLDLNKDVAWKVDGASRKPTGHPFNV